MPGNEVISTKALERGIHPCSLNLTDEEEYPFFFLKFPKLNDFCTDAVARAFTSSFFFAISIR